MVTWATFRNTVASVISTLDTVDQCNLESLVDNHVWDKATCDDIWEVVQKMAKSGLVCFDGQVKYEWQKPRDIVCITPKGRALAADIRKLTERAVRA